MSNLPDGWSAYERMVLDKLSTLEKDVAILDEKVTLLRIDVARLKVKAGLWGGIAGLIPGMLGVAVLLLNGGGSVA